MQWYLPYQSKRLFSSGGKENKNLNIGYTSQPVSHITFDNGNQCDKIGRFLKVYGDKFNDKHNFWMQLLWNFLLRFIPSSGHTDGIVGIIDNLIPKFKNTWD